MPPFTLEAPQSPPLHRRKPQLIYTKNLYGEGVKVKNWQNAYEQIPFDVNPLCQGKVNHFLSHYHRFGIEDSNLGTTTTTKEMLEQVFLKNKLFPEKLMNCYYTYTDNAECLTAYEEPRCNKICSYDFLTTMQHSYRVPKPYIMQRLAIPKIPFMQNRKYRKEIPDWSDFKFYDDNFERVTCELRKHKSWQSKSFNFVTGNYTAS